MRRFVIVTVCLAALLTGCEQATKIDVAENRRELTNVIERGHGELSAQHIQMMQGNIETLKAEVEKSKANAAEAINKANEASLKAIAEEQARLKDIQTVREFVNVLVPEQAAKVVTALTGGIDTKIQTLNALTQDIQSKVSVATERVNSTESRLASVDSTVTEVNKNLLAVDANAKMAALVADRNEKGTEKLGDNLDNRTRDGLLSLLAATGVATGGGTALARRGKSRAADDVKKLESQCLDIEKVISGIQTKLAKS